MERCPSSHPQICSLKGISVLVHAQQDASAAKRQTGCRKKITYSADTPLSLKLVVLFLAFNASSLFFSPSAVILMCLLRRIMPDQITVSEFIAETTEDYNSPTTSSFTTRLQNCRNTVTLLEEVNKHLSSLLAMRVVCWRVRSALWHPYCSGYRAHGLGLQLYVVLVLLIDIKDWVLAKLGYSVSCISFNSDNNVNGSRSV